MKLNYRNIASYSFQGIARYSIEWYTFVTMYGNKRIPIFYHYLEIYIIVTWCKLKLVSNDTTPSNNVFVVYVKSFASSAKRTVYSDMGTLLNANSLI